MSSIIFKAGQAWAFEPAMELETKEATTAPEVVDVEAGDACKVAESKENLSNLNSDSSKGDAGSPVAANSDGTKVEEVMRASTSVTAEVLDTSRAGRIKARLAMSALAYPRDATISAQPGGGDGPVILNPGMHINKSIHAFDDDTRSRPILPGEIMKKVIKYAMTANNGGKIKMPCLTDRAFTPNIAVGLLRVNRAIYHEAIQCLYTENEFIFDHFGSDLRVLNKPTMISSCMVGQCRCASSVPYVRVMRFEIGSHLDTYMAKVSTSAFQTVLSSLRRPFLVEKLTLHFHIHSCLSFEALEDLVKSLDVVRVARILTITGPERHHYGPVVHDIAAALGMMPIPTWSFAIPARSHDYSPSISDAGFSYFRFKTDLNVADYDWYEGKLIQEAAAQEAYADEFEK